MWIKDSENNTNSLAIGTSEFFCNYGILLYSEQHSHGCWFSGTCTVHVGCTHTAPHDPLHPPLKNYNNYSQFCEELCIALFIFHSWSLKHRWIEYVNNNNKCSGFHTLSNSGQERFADYSIKRKQPKDSIWAITIWATCSLVMAAK